MGEVSNPEAKPEKKSGMETYIELLDKIQNEPNSDELWQHTVDIARDEEISGGGLESYYTKIPLDELIAIGERLRATKERVTAWDGKVTTINKDLFDLVKPKQYAILAERCSTGEYWYDIILGHVNDKAFIPVTMRLEHLLKARRKRKFRAGLDVGCGLGNTLRAVAPYCEKVVGVEKLAPLVKLVKKDASMPKNTEIKRADALELPFADGTFDVVVSNGLTHYIRPDYIYSYAQEISRVMKEGGRYLEAFTVKEPGNQLPNTEAEYLTSAKALLVCLIDNVITKNDDKGDNPPWYLRSMSGGFEDSGVYARKDQAAEREKDDNAKNIGAVVVEFIKNRKEGVRFTRSGMTPIDD